MPWAGCGDSRSRAELRLVGLESLANDYIAKRNLQRVFGFGGKVGGSFFPSNNYSYSFCCYRL